MLACVCMSDYLPVCGISLFGVILPRVTLIYRGETLLHGVESGDVRTEERRQPCTKRGSAAVSLHRPAGHAGVVQGGAVQVDPSFARLTPRLLSGTFRDFQLLKLKHDAPLSNFAFNLNLRPSDKAARREYVERRVTRTYHVRRRQAAIYHAMTTWKNWKREER